MKDNDRRMAPHQKSDSTNGAGLQGALAFPFIVLRRGGLGYFAYVGALGALLILAASHLNTIFLAHSAELVQTGEMTPFVYGYVKAFIPIFLALLAAPIIVGGLGEAARLLSQRHPRSLTALVRGSPAAMRRAGIALVPTARRAFILTIPIFFATMIYSLLELRYQLSDRAFYGAFVVGTAILAPLLWRLLVVMMTPLIAVCGELGGQKTAAEAALIASRCGGLAVKVLLAVTTLLAAKAWLEGAVPFEIPPLWMTGWRIFVLWYTITALAGVFIRSAPEASSKSNNHSTL